MNNSKLKYNNGAAMMMFVIFLMFGSTTVIVGIVGPVMREFQIAKSSLESKSTYYLAESGVEDALYRLKNSKQIGASETLVLGATSTTTTITTLSGSQKQITSLGDTNSYQRKVDIVINTTVGTSFNYGLQAGNGGVNMSGGATINGNIYSNASINAISATITGSAVAADGSALTLDQVSDTPSTPLTLLNFRQTIQGEDLVQSFKLSSNTSINKIQFYLKKVGNPANATIRLVTDNAGSPSTTNIAIGTVTLNASQVTTSYGWVDVVFASYPTLTAGTTYWVVIDSSTYNAGNYYIMATGSSYGNGAVKLGRYGIGGWTSFPTLDAYFRVYTGGVTSTIGGASYVGGVTIGSGSVGDAWGTTVKGATVNGNLYCTTGTNNNKSCDTSRGSPPSLPMPLSDANIQAWKDEALTGGTISGDYSVGWAGATLGPKKIVGNLTVSGGGTLVVTGTLWVTGAVTLNGGGKIQLSSSYGSNDGVIVSDGKLEINGGGNATGSGTTGSYIMMLSTKTGTAADVDGGAGAVIVATPNGTLTISGGASLKEATGYAININGGSSVTYETGLANLNFSSGPSGSYSISSWKETQ